MPLAALVGLLAGCATVRQADPLTHLARYQRLFLTMPSHAAGFGVDAAPSPFGAAAPVASTRSVVDDAYDSLRRDLTGAGFEMVESDGEADALLELTVGGVRGDGDAERAFVAMRDAQSGRLVAFFRAHSREDVRSVDELMTGLAEAITGMIRNAPAPSAGY